MIVCRDGGGSVEVTMMTRVVVCVGGVTGATLPRSVTVGDRLAQKSDRHRPLSLRPVSLRRRIYMQFLLIVLYRGGFSGGRSSRHHYQCCATADTSVILRTVTTGRVQWLPKNWKTLRKLFYIFFYFNFIVITFSAYFHCRIDFILWRVIKPITFHICFYHSLSFSNDALFIYCPQVFCFYKRGHVLSFYIYYYLFYCLPPQYITLVIPEIIPDENYAL